MHKDCMNIYFGMQMLNVYEVDMTRVNRIVVYIGGLLIGVVN